MKKIWFLVMTLCVRGIFSQDFAAGMDAAAGLKLSPNVSGLFRVSAFGKPLILPLASEDANAQPERTKPQWLRDLRRGEIVAFGSFPLTIFFTTFFLDLYRCAVHDWDTRYAPWPVKSAGAVSLTDGEVRMMFTIAISASLTIAIADHILVRAKRAKSRRNKQAVEVIIKRELDLPE